MIRYLAASALLLAALALPSGARAQDTTLDGRPPFYATLSNIRPLAFGMDVGEASAALKQPLQYVSGPAMKSISRFAMSAGAG